MRIVCNSTQSSAPALVLPKKLDQKFDENNFTAYCGYTICGELCGFDVSVCTEYEVYGILLYKGQIRYLIQDDRNIPAFCPAELFTIKTCSVFWDWRINEFSVDNCKLLLIAYPALLEEYQNLIDLIDLRSEAVEVFLAYKAFMEQYDITSL